MAVPSGHTAKSHSHRLLLCHLLTSLVLAGILNSCESGRHSGQNDEEEGFISLQDSIEKIIRHNRHMNATDNPLQNLNPHLTWGNANTTWSPNMSKTANTTTTFWINPNHTLFGTTPAPLPGPKLPSYDPYSPVLKMMIAPLRESDLEPSIDYYSEKALIKEYNFNSMDILKQLIDSANSEKTPPAQFLEEIQNLITLQNRSRTEQNEGSKGRDESPSFPPSFLPEAILKSVYDGWKNELKRLEKKYNISSECSGPDSITAARLALMFPHYLNLGQKPFAVPSEVSISDNVNYNYNSYRVPSFFKRPEFGGLIPRYALNDTTRRVIIGTHLYALYRDEQNDMMPFRTKCMILRWRMEKSVLSEERRVRLLRNNDIITSDEQLLSTSLRNVFNNFIPNDFKNKIDWNLLGVPSLPVQSGPGIHFF